MVRAYNIISLPDKSKPTIVESLTNSINSKSETNTLLSTNSAPKNEQIYKNIRDKLAKYTPRERSELVAQARNFLFIRNWETNLPRDSFTKQIDQRGPYDLDNETFIYIQFGRLTGITELLEPGETSSTSILAFIPNDYEVVSIDCEGIASKKWTPNLTWIGVPVERGISLIPFDSGPDLPKLLANFRNSVGQNLSNGTISKIETNLDRATFRFHQHVESYIQPHLSSGITNSTNADSSKSR